MMFKDYLTDKKNHIEEVLKTLLQTKQPQFGPLYESMNYSLMAGGKRIRPILMLATIEALGHDAAPYTEMACALECIHTYSLIHDDLPCMDDDDLRRGKPTNHVIYGPGIATLAGDGLLTFAFELLARQKDIDPDKLNRCIAVIAEAAGPSGMVGGQAFDLASDGKMDIGREGMELLHRSKTGVIFKAAIDMAAIVSDAEPAVRKALDEYATYMGLTFQITDDILDVVGDDALLGKPVGSDLKNDKATYVTIFSLEDARQMAKDASDKAVRALEPLGDKAWFLKELVEHLLTRVH